MGDDPLKSIIFATCSQGTTNAVNDKIKPALKKGTAINFCGTWEKARTAWAKGDHSTSLKAYEGVYKAAKKAKTEQDLPAAFLSEYFTVPAEYMDLFIKSLPTEILELAKNADDQYEFDYLIDQLTSYAAYYFALLYTESRFDPEKKTLIGIENNEEQYAYGIGQLRPGTANETAIKSGKKGYDLSENPDLLFDKKLNMSLSLKYFTKILEKEGYFKICAPFAMERTVKSYKMGPKYKNCKTKQARALVSEIEDFAAGIMKYHKAEIANKLKNKLSPVFKEAQEQKIRDQNALYIKCFWQQFGIK